MSTINRNIFSLIELKNKSVSLLLQSLAKQKKQDVGNIDIIYFVMKIPTKIHFCKRPTAFP